MDDDTPFHKAFHVATATLCHAEPPRRPDDMAIIRLPPPAS
jgi:hypothetical protein